MSLTSVKGDVDVDNLMKRPFGELLIYSGKHKTDTRYQCRREAAFLQSKHNDFHGGEKGHQYIDMFTEELSQVAMGIILLIM